MRIVLIIRTHIAYKRISCTLGVLILQTEIDTVLIEELTFLQIPLDRINFSWVILEFDDSFTSANHVWYTANHCLDSIELNIFHCV